MKALRSLIAIAIVSFFAAHPAAAATTLSVTTGSTSITHDADQHVWTLKNDRLQLIVSADVGIEPRPLKVVVPETGQAFNISNGPDGRIEVDGDLRRIGHQADGFRVMSVDASLLPQGVKLDVRSVLDALHITVTRHYALYDGSPTVEVWTTLTSSAPELHTLEDMNAFDLSVPQGTLQWVNGLQGDRPGTERRSSAFSIQGRTLSDGETMALGASGRSSEQVVPWISINAGTHTFFSGLMWSGAWGLSLARTGSTVAVTAGLGAMSTALDSGATVDGPHGFFGVIPGGSPNIAEAIQPFIINGVRKGRRLTPLVTFNTWFTYGTRIDEESMREEMTYAAAFGAELFVIDAGWYVGAGRQDYFDFTSGLGNWQVDHDRFPSGLGALADLAHDLGMKFGIWVEPERVDFDLLNQPGMPDEAWMATSGGDYRAERAGQLCLASGSARRWLFSQLTTLIDEVGPDYLKWDNNLWINCDRPGHGHGSGDGNFAHVNGLYDVLGSLRARYPTLLIENVSGGGNRLDVGMLRYSDVAWMDDRTAPSAHVRHNTQGLSAIFPPAYLLSFALDDENERLHNASDLGLYMRSRMEGVLGLCIRGRDFSDEEIAAIAAEVTHYKSFRDTLASSSAALLTSQAAVEGGPAWDILQTRDASSTSIILTAVQSDEAVTSANVRPRDLNPTTVYEVESIDTGPLGSATGADLMSNGIELFESPVSAAHVLTLKAIGAGVEP